MKLQVMERHLILLRFLGTFCFCVLNPAYTSLRRGLEYLLKVRYIIIVDPNGVRFLIFEYVFGQVENTAQFLKNTSQK